MAKCCDRRMKDWHYVGCSREATGEYDGRPYCTQHNPKLEAEREAKRPKCQAETGCSTSVPKGVKYCGFHERVTIPRDRWLELLAIEASVMKVAK